MPITRSLRRQAVKCESAPDQPKKEHVHPEKEPASIAAIHEPTPRCSKSSARSSGSKRSAERAEALKKLAAAKLEEARAATALAEAEIAAIDAVSENEDGDSLNLRKDLVEDWLDTHIQSPQKCPQTNQDNIDIKALTTALTDAARAMHRPQNIFELPIFSGACSEWLAFKTAYSETCSKFSKLENAMRLRRCLKGDAKDAAISLFIADIDPSEVISLLESRFGRPDTLVIAEMDKIKGLSRLTDNPNDICMFANKVINIVTVVRALKKDFYLYNPESVRTVVEKMTPSIRYRWYDFAADRAEEEADLVKLSDFFSREANLCSRYAQAETLKKPSRACLAITPGPSKTNKTPIECPVCRDSHKITSCTQFKDLVVKDRWETSKQFNLCFRCLGRRQFRHRCPYKACGVDDCKGSHHPLLHTPKEAESNPAVVASTRPRMLQRAYLKIVPVTLKGPTSSAQTFALLDEGSTVTLIEEEIARAIGLTGPIEPFNIEGIGGTTMDANTSQRVLLSVSGTNKIENTIEARTIHKLNLAPQTIDAAIVQGCKYLEGVVEDLVYESGVPSLLIGQDNWHIIVTRSIKSGTRSQPAASLTGLGWVLHGPHERRKEIVKFHDICKVHKEEDNLDSLFKQYLSIDGLGIEPRSPRNDPDVRALSLLEKHSRRLSDGRFETCLLWRREDIQLPENKESTLRRLEGIEKKLDKDTYLKQQYKMQIEHLLNSGYAEVAPPSYRPGRTWYLPHFPVLNPSKPKPRIVLDAAAKTCGVSLNDNLLTGPDLLQLLPGILMRFRQKPVAIIGDLKEMFLQISIREEDRDALRFLWREDQQDGPPVEYRMRSVIFGAASSPCTAIYIKNRNAEEYQDKFPEAAKAIRNNHYMDDYLQSFDNQEDAIRISKEVRYIHQQAKFELQKWASNIPEVIASIDPKQKVGEEQEHILSSPEKALGLLWKTNEDKLAFNLDLKRVNPEVIARLKRPTKREFLRVIMSIFDPLGLVTPVTLPVKGLLQETWRLGVDWDDFLPDDLHSRWLEWLVHMKKLENISIPRCYVNCSSAKELELHIFVDASESAYVACVYWRAESEDGGIHISLVIAKGRVAPLKIISIPRLELQAAVLGCRLAQTVQDEHDFSPTRRIFWTDSRTVLAWLRSGPRVFKPFVAHRVAEIEEISKVNEWRWVPTLENVADDATRGVPANFKYNHRWFHGPQFLYSSEDSWPKEPQSSQSQVTGEERVLTITNRTNKLIEALPDVNRFSSWIRLIRTTGRVLQFIDLCRKRRHTSAVAFKRSCRTHTEDSEWKPNTPHPKSRRSNVASPKGSKDLEIKYIALEPHHLSAAEKFWWRSVQEESFPDELVRLQKNLAFGRDSRLRTLSVKLDSEGIIRLKSRIDASFYLNEEQRNPPILDGGHTFCRLFIAHTHSLNHHAGPETVMNEIRSRVWVIRLRPITRSIIKTCVTCRKLLAKPPLPATGDHPSSRLAHHQRPFSFVGLDYFGPYSVTVGRHHEKRYVALFTCLTTRAIHLEIAGSLSTDSAIMALRRMMARRGCPTEIHSDNGTNLRGADTELKRAAYGVTRNEAEVRAVKWRFIPPGAPFMGGAWERMVQSVKRALAATLKERNPTEEVLNTLLMEAEYTVNNRPLTPVSDSSEDVEALTPLHFILGGPARVPQPGSFEKSDLNHRRTWRRSQQLANMFWTRWVKEYMLLILQFRRDPKSRGETPQRGDLVLLVDGALARNSWPRGRVVDTFPGKDGVTRVVDVHTKAGVLRRPTKKVIVLIKGSAQNALGGECAR